MPEKLKPVTKLEGALYKALPELQSPEWFGEVLDAARKHYRRIDRSKLSCPICRHAVHVATDCIEKDLSKDFGPDAVDCTPLTFAFYGCAHGLPDFPVNTRAGRTDEGWGAVAAFFIRDVANPGDEKAPGANASRYSFPGYVLFALSWADNYNRRRRPDP
jgi:hypothetical protein